MAYGKILVDQVENSDGKSLNVGPSARVFDTVTDLQASTTLSDGDIVIVKERANAEYEIQPGTYTALNGDLTLTSGQVAELQLKPVNDVRWWGVVDDMDYDTGLGTDNTDALQSAIDRGTGYTTHALHNGGDGLIGVASTVKITRGYIDLDLHLLALDSFDAGTVELPDDWVDREYVTTKYTFEEDSYDGRQARGNPILRATYVDVPDSLGYTRDADFAGCNFKLTLDGRDVAPCYYQEKMFHTTIVRMSCINQKYYGAAFVVKNGCKVLDFTSYEFLWGTDKYYRTEEPNSIGLIVSCNDIIFENVIAHYCNIPIYFGSSGANQMGLIHVFNGPNSRDGIFFSARSNTTTCDNLYLDGVEVALRSYNHSFVQNFCLDHDDETPFMVYANEESTYLTGLNITNTGVGTDSNGVCTFIEDSTNKFVAARGTNVLKPYYINDTSPTSAVPYDSYLDKDIRFTIDSSDWVSTSDIYTYSLDLSNYKALPNTLYSTTIRYSVLSRSSSDETTSTANLPTVFVEHDITGSILRFYSNTSRTMVVDLKLIESSIS